MEDKAILYIVTVSSSLNFVRGQVLLMKSRGWRTAVSSSPLSSGGVERFGYDQNAESYPISLEREINLRQDLKSLLQVYKIIRSFRPLVVNVGTPKAGLIGGIAAVLAGVPLRIYTLHGLRFETVTGAKGLLLRQIEKLSMSCAHYVVCVSPSLQERVKELKLAPDNKVMILGGGSANGVNLPNPIAYGSLSTSIGESLGIRPDQKIIGFVGRFTKDKGLVELIKAFESIQLRLPKVRLLLVGDYEEGDPIPDITRFAIENMEGIIRTGLVEDATPYYALMDVLALPTYREGLPTVVLEAFAMGIPVVATNATGARDVVKNGVTGWQVPIGDWKALENRLVEALEDPIEASKRGEKGLALVKEQFLSEDVQKRWAEFYDSALLSIPSRQNNRRAIVFRFTLITTVAYVAKLLTSIIIREARNNLNCSARKSGGFK